MDIHSQNLKAMKELIERVRAYREQLEANKKPVPAPVVVRRQGAPQWAEASKKR